MKDVVRFVLKVVALALVVAAAVCAVVAFSDKIGQFVGAAANKLCSRKSYADGCCVEEDDYADWDE